MCVGPSRLEIYAIRRLSGAHVTSASTSGVVVTRVASPPSRADAAKTSPRATNAIFFPSGDNDSHWKPPLSVACSTLGDALAPRSVIGTSLALPVATSKSHTPKSRSKTIALPSYEIVGHNTRPVLNDVTARSSPPATGFDQRFSGPS